MKDRTHTQYRRQQMARYGDFTEHFNFRVTRAVSERTNRLAREEGVTASDIIRQCLDTALPALESDELGFDEWLENRPEGDTHTDVLYALLNAYNLFDAPYLTMVEVIKRRGRAVETALLTLKRLYSQYIKEI
jgi:hypothetical protein